MFQFIANAVILLTIAVTLLSIFAIISRQMANGREARIGAMRGVMLEAVNKFLANEIELDAVVPAVPKDRAVALGGLVSAAVSCPAEKFPRLRVLIEHLHLHEGEIVALRHRDWTRRAHAATRLGLLRVYAATPELVVALNDAMLDVRLAAAHALAQLQATSAVEPILRSLALPVAWPLQRCAEILHEMGPAAIAPLLEAQRGGRLPASAITVVAKVLGMLKAQDAVPTLITYLKHPNDEIRVSSAKALGQIGSAEAAKPLRDALNDAEWPVRSAAAKSLAQVNDRGAVPALAARLADPAWWVRFNAAEALYRLNGGTELQAAMSGHADRFARDISRQVLEQFGVLRTQGVPA